MTGEDFMTDLALQHDPMRQSAAALRKTLKAEIDTWPKQVLVAFWEFVNFERHGANMPGIDEREAILEKRRQAFEELKPYFGTVHLDKPWKEELYEALDEKYNRPR
jgi:hypothetical protein